MVFSTLFGKKKDKEPEVPAKTGNAGARPAAPNRAAVAAGPVTEPPTTAPPTTAPATRPPAASPREIARATAEKIDKIESEMALDYPGRNASGAKVVYSSRTAAPAPAEAAPRSGSGIAAAATAATSDASSKKRGKRNDGSSTLPSLGQTTDILLGDSILANAMELADSASSPAIEEAAILYANGQPLPAVAVLADAVRTEPPGAHNLQAWLMLFELYQLTGKRTEFDNLAIDYAVKFETSSPTWSESASRAAPPPPAAVAPARAAVAFKGMLGNGIVPQLDQLKRLAQRNSTVFLDFRQVTGADEVGADLILRVFAAFQKSNHEVVLEGADVLAEKLLSAIEVGRRDPSNAVWMLLLEIYRILGRQAAFEETSIDYCVTYEVSPPSWEPPPPKFRLGDAPAAGLAPEGVEGATPGEGEVAEVPGDTVALSGDLLGKAESDLQRLANFTAEHRRIVVDCAQLRRVDFTAAGVLLNWAVSAQSGGKSIEFRSVSNLVAALLVVMGLNEVAQIERQKL